MRALLRGLVRRRRTGTGSSRKAPSVKYAGSCIKANRETEDDESAEGGGVVDEF